MSGRGSSLQIQFDPQLTHRLHLTEPSLQLQYTKMSFYPLTSGPGELRPQMSGCLCSNSLPCRQPNNRCTVKEAIRRVQQRLPKPNPLLGMEA